MQKTSSLSIFPILLVNFIGTLGYSIVLPFLVILVLKFGGNELIYGIMGATYSFFQLIGAPVLGNWSDRIGRKMVLLVSQTGTFIAWGIFLIALLIPSNDLFRIDSGLLGTFVLTAPLLLLFLARVLDGITGGNVSVANAYLADITIEEDRNTNYGKMSAAGNLGFIIGPAAAGVLGATVLGDILPVIMAMIISLVAIGAIKYGLQDNIVCKELEKSVDISKTRKILGQEHKECHKMTGEDKYKFADILRLKNVPFLLLIYFMIFLAFNFFYVAFPVHAIKNLGWSVFHLGIFFSILGGVMVIFQGPVLARVSHKFSDGILVTAGCTLLAIGFFLFIYSNVLTILIGILLFAAGNGIMWPSFLSMISKSAETKYQGAVQGFASSSGSLASIIGLITGGILFGVLGPNTFILPAVIMVLIFLASFRLHKIGNR